MRQQTLYRGGGGGGADSSLAPTAGTRTKGNEPRSQTLRLTAGARCMVYHRCASSGQHAFKQHATTPKTGICGKKQVPKTTNTEHTDTNKEPP